MGLRFGRLRLELGRCPFGRHCQCLCFCVSVNDSAESACDSPRRAPTAGETAESSTATVDIVVSPVEDMVGQWVSEDSLAEEEAVPETPPPAGFAEVVPETPPPAPCAPETPPHLMDRVRRQEGGLDVGWRFIRALNPKPHPKGPSTQLVDKLAPKYPNRHYFKAKVYTIWVHGLLGNPKP